jgi:copper homeostasis protein
LGVTFHRAFDRTRDAFEALETIIDIGCERILTSGLTPNVTEGTSMLTQLVEAADNRITIMPGSGVKSSNINALATQTRAVEFHTSARIMAASKMNYLNKEMKEDLQSVMADEDEIRKILAELESCNNYEPPF